MTRARAGASRVPNALMAEYYHQRANAGLIITEATTISPQANGWGWTRRGLIPTSSRRDGCRWCRRFTTREAGYFSSSGIWAVRLTAAFMMARLPVAPSAIKINGDYIHTPLGKTPYETPRALDLSEIPGRGGGLSPCRGPGEGGGF